MAFEINNLVAAFFIISLYSVIIKDNLLYRFCERTFVGVTIGITITQAVSTIRNSAFTPLIQGQYSVLVAIILGVLMLTRFSKEHAWLSRYPIALITGLGVALWTRTSVEAQIIGSIRPYINTPLITNNLITSLSSIFSLICLVGGLLYFIFATEGIPTQLNAPISYLSRIGRYCLMMMLGTSFAHWGLGRSSMLLERIHFLLQTFGLII